MKCDKTKKIRYKTRLDCDIAIASVRGKYARHRSQRFEEEPQRSYCCPFCLGWHMTSQNKGRDEEQAD